MARVVVVGDALLDRDVQGSATRLCPDGPAPVVDVETVSDRPGGAALAAALARRHGVATTLVCALAADDTGRRLGELVRHSGVELCDLGAGGATPEKVRVRVRGQSLLRLDHGGLGAMLPASAAARAALDHADAVLVADYGRGVAAEPSVRALVADAVRRGCPVVWDPHPNGPPPLPATVVTPNDAEARRAEPGVAGTSLAADVERARRLRRRWRARSVVVTLGERGAVGLWGDGAPLAVPIDDPAEGRDTCGAGDAFAAALTVELALGRVQSDAVQAAVASAAEFVRRGGAARLAVHGDGAPVRLAAPLDRAPAAGDGGAGADGDDGGADGGGGGGGILVATGGCFDIVHAGHAHLLQSARRLGDRLVVLLNSDRSVRRLKGPGRPAQTVADRAAVLRAMRCVDDVVVFDEDTPIDALRRLRPHVFVKGGDYTSVDLPEARALDAWGGVIVTVPYLPGRSTTSLLTAKEHVHAD